MTTFEATDTRASLLRLWRHSRTLAQPRSPGASLAYLLEQALIRDIIESGREADRELQLDGFEPAELVNAISHMIGSGEAGPVLTRLRDRISGPWPASPR